MVLIICFLLATVIILTAVLVDYRDQVARYRDAADTANIGPLPSPQVDEVMDDWDGDEYWESCDLDNDCCDDDCGGCT